MLLKSFLFILLLHYTVQSINNTIEEFNAIDTKDESNKQITLEKNTKQKFFKDNLRSKQQKKYKKNIINKNKNMTVDNIIHYEFNKSNNDYKKIMKLERDYFNLMRMEGYQYFYERGSVWRTWRSVLYPNKTVIVYSYRCQNSDIESKNSCNSGYWTIENEPPQCPYEILSMNKNDTVCAVKLTDIYTNFNSCAHLVSSNQLITECHNPIKTLFKFSKTYNDVRPAGSLCGDADECKFTTSYEIHSDKISFRIIKDNNILYSKIMTKGNVSYVCIKNCGYSEKKTKVGSAKIGRNSKSENVQVSTSDKHVKRTNHNFKKLTVLPNKNKKVVKKYKYEYNTATYGSVYPHKNDPQSYEDYFNIDN